MQAFMSSLSIIDQRGEVADGAARLGDLIDPERIVTDSGGLDPERPHARPVAVVQDQLGIHENRPDIVVRVTSTEDVINALAVARETRTPLTARGLGSSVTGQALPTKGGIVLDLALLVGEPSFDEMNMTVTASAGMRGSDLEEWLNYRGYTLNFFPQS